MRLHSMVSKLLSKREPSATDGKQVARPYCNQELMAIAFSLLTGISLVPGTSKAQLLSSRSPASAQTCEAKREVFVTAAKGKYQSESLVELNPQIEVTSEHKLNVSWNSGTAVGCGGFTASLDDSSCPVAGTLKIFPRDNKYCAITLTVTRADSSSSPQLASVSFKRECLPTKCFDESAILSISRLKQVLVTEP